jgi:hypothetical protein
VLIYRQPVEVVLSLIRRGVELDLEVLANPIVGLKVWQVYNEAILNFYRQHSQVCLLGHIDNITTNMEGFIRSTAKKLDLPLQATDVQALYHTAELKRIDIPEAGRLILERIAPDVMKLYAQLESQADLPDQPFSQTMVEQTSPLAGLEGIVSNLANQDKLSESQAADYFTLLLTMLDPQAMVVGKVALDKFRVNYLNHLAAHATNLETHTTNLEAHRANLEAHVANLEAHISNLEAHTANLEAHTANLEAHIANLECLLAGKEANIQVLKEKIEAIERTKVWQLASKWYGFKHFLAGSK